MLLGLRRRETSVAEMRAEIKGGKKCELAAIVRVQNTPFPLSCTFLGQQPSHASEGESTRERGSEHRSGVKHTGSMNLDKALGLMGVSGGAGQPPPMAVDMGNGKKATKEAAPETKKQKEARLEKEKLEKKKAKIAAAMFKKDDAPKKPKEKKEDKAAPAAEGASSEAAASSTATDGAAATPKAAKPTRVHKPRVISDEERKRAMDAERRIADEAERAFATAYQCASAHKAVSAEAIDYHVRSAEELEQALKEREASVADAAAAKQKTEVADTARKAISKAGCLISFEEWELLTVAASA